jgi:hypothetical protein
MVSKGSNMLQRERATLADHLLELSAWGRTLSSMAQRGIAEVAASGSLTQGAFLAAEFNRMIEAADECVASIEQTLRLDVEG